MTNTHLRNLGISILDITPTDLEMDDLTPRQLEDVKKVTRTKNLDLDMREFLGIDKALTRITGEVKKQRLKIDRDRRRPPKRTQKAH